MKMCAYTLLLALGATPFDQSLRQIARDQGGTASNSIDYLTPLTTVSQLLKDADYVVHAKVVSTNTMLTFDERLVATEYTILPLEVFKYRASLNSSSKPGPLPPTVVRRIGGTVIEGEYRYATSNSGVPEAEAPSRLHSTRLSAVCARARSDECPPQSHPLAGFGDEARHKAVGHTADANSAYEIREEVRPLSKSAFAQTLSKMSRSALMSTLRNQGGE